MQSGLFYLVGMAQKRYGKKEAPAGSEAGRPPEYDNPQEMWAKIQEYFDLCANSDPVRVKTVPGLAYHLGFASKQSIYDYSTDPKFAYVIKRALAVMEDGRLQQAMPALAVMDMKNNYGYRDRSEVEIGGIGGGAIQVALEVTVKG